jgi:hypothetical protein
VLALSGAPAALADTATSDNWAGYAVHRSGVKFRKAWGIWREPSATCVSGAQTFSAYWVGIGGFSAQSNALEQIGTEVDCNLAGSAQTSVWYELVPAASRPIRMAVEPGDLMSASVTVVGHESTLALTDVSRNESFKRTLYTPIVDTSSAEWIVEAPSACVTATSCQTLPLSNFASATFAATGARTTTGRTGTIGSSGWTATRITLSPSGRPSIASSGGGPAAGGATTSLLRLNGSSFSVTFGEVSLKLTRLLGRLLRLGTLRH